MGTNSELQFLRQLARVKGIQTSYSDVFGKRHEASVETLRGVLEAIGIAKEIDPKEALRLSKAEKKLVEPVIVSWDGKPRRLAIRVPAQWAPGSVGCQILLEDGGVVACPIRGNQITIPKLPMGYHTLDLLTPKENETALLISAPSRSYQEPGSEKNWGLFLPVYACHSKESWGAGNFSDWMRFTNWAASLGAKVVGTLPLLAAFLDKPFEPSPYSPMSRLFWNEFYVDVTKVAEFAICPAAQKLVGSPEFQSQIAKFRASELVDYRVEMALKRNVLDLLAELFFSREDQRRGEFERFVAEHPEVSPYAEFRAVCDARQKTWPTWPQRLRNGELRETDFSPAVRDYHLYAQWAVQQQIEHVTARCCERGVNFYLDFPLGVNPGGYDGWRYREQFAEGVSAGAPPDAFFTKGQNWGFAPLDPQRMRVNGYAYLLQVMRFQMRHTGMLRIDHVMGLHRLYWVPDGMPASEGAYVTYPAEELYALLCLESVRNETALVGENLGTVPPEVNRSMDRHGLRKMFVLQYELRPKASAPVSAPARNSVASLNTHDMPTFAAFWEGLDVKERGEMGLLKGEELGREDKTRAKVKTALIAFLRRKRFLKASEPWFEEILEAVLNFLGASKAEMVLVTLEDLWGERSPQNVPGTSTERPNWQRKTRLPLESFNEDARVLELLKTVDTARKEQHQSPK